MSAKQRKTKREVICHQGGRPLGLMGTHFLDEKEMNAGGQVDFNFLSDLGLPVAAHILGSVPVIFLLSLAIDSLRHAQGRDSKLILILNTLSR